MSEVTTLPTPSDDRPAAPVPLPSEPDLTGPVPSSTAPLVIRPRSGWQPVDLAELWRYRELLWFLALRDVKVRYKQTALGAAWAVIQPLFTMVVFTLFFGHLAGLDKRIEGNTPYAVYAFTALLPWQLFAFALSQGSNSVVNSRGLITKVYFPRLIVPIAPLLCGLLDFAIGFGVLAGLMLWYGIVPGWPVLTLPLFILFALATSLAVSLWLSALNAMYRDVQYTLPFLTQFWLFLTPVAYPSSIVPERWRWLYGLNPMAGVVDGFRWALLGGSPPGPLVLVSALATCALLVGGLFFYRRMERTFADVV
jgi:lipopolysaccharide transport system permease protein